MMSKLVVAFVLVSLGGFSAHLALGQEQVGRTYSRADFINVEGSSLADKIERAVRQFRDSRRGDSLWIAYHFQAREGVRMGPFSGLVYRDEDGILLARAERPDGAAVFLLTEVRSSRPVFTRVKTLNLNEPYLFENRPVYWLGNVETAQSLAQLEAIMRAEPENKPLVRDVLRAISAHDSPRVLPLLREVALKDPTFDIQSYAISSLARIPTKESLDTLDELFKTTSSVALKQEIMRAYTQAGGSISEKRVLDKLTAIASSDETLKVRTEAIRRIASFRGDAVADRLFEIYDRSQERELKLEVLRQVRVNENKEDRGLKRMIAIAKNGADAELQRAAVGRLAGVKGDVGISALIEIYDSTGSDQLKEELISRLAQSQSRQAMEKVLAIAKNDPNPRLRRLAVRRLSSSGWNFSLQ
jgi:HEAT repeat protein